MSNQQGSSDLAAMVAAAAPATQEGIPRPEEPEPPGQLPVPANGPSRDGGRRDRDGVTYSWAVPAITGGLTPGVYQRCLAYWAARPKVAEKYTRDQQLTLYLELATLDHAELDEQRPEGQRLYDWRELHMDGLRDLMKAELQAETELIVAEASQGTRKAILARIGQIAPPEVLAAIKGMVLE